MEELELELKQEIIKVLNLEDMTPDDIETDAPLFGEGLGLDSIDVLEIIVLLEKEGGKKASIDVKKASKDELAAYVGEVLPNFDRDRVFPSDMKKLVQWYDILVENGLTDFDEALKETEGDNIDSRKA